MGKPPAKRNAPAATVMKRQDLASADLQKMRDADLSGIITNGRGKMPRRETMKADQLNHMDAFIRSLKR